MRRLLIGLLLVAASCGDAASPPVDSAGSPATTVAGSELVARCGAVTVPVGRTALLPDEPLDEDARAAMEQARALGVETLFFDGYDWFVAERAADRLVLFGRLLIQTGPGEAAHADASFDREGGSWRLAGFGQCRIVVEAAGLGNAVWVLDAEPTAGAAELQVLVNERACANGRPPVDRRIVPFVVADADRVTVTVLVEPVAGDATCPSNPWHPFTVDLGEALGDRPLFDGSAVPPLPRPWPPTAESLDSFGQQE